MLMFVVKEGGDFSCNCLNPFCMKNKAIFIFFFEKDSNAMMHTKPGPMEAFAHSSTSTRGLALISIATSIVQPIRIPKSVILHTNSK